MNKKILIKVIILSLEMEYEMYIPNNKKVGTIKKYFIKSIVDLYGLNFTKDESKIRFIDKETGLEIENNVCVKDSGIKNGSIILVI